MVLHQRPGVVVHTVALVDQQLTQISGRHVSRDLHRFAGAVLAPHFDYLEKDTGGRRGGTSGEGGAEQRGVRPEEV